MEQTDRKRPGRKRLPPGEKKQYERQPVSLRPDQWENLHEIPGLLDIVSRSGPNYDKPSWRTMLALMADNKDKIKDIVRYLKRLAAALRITVKNPDTEQEEVSWKELVRLIVQALPHVVEAVEARQQDEKRTYYPIQIAPNVTLTIRPPKAKAKAKVEEVEALVAPTEHVEPAVVGGEEQS